MELFSNPAFGFQFKSGKAAGLDKLDGDAEIQLMTNGAGDLRLQRGGIGIGRGLQAKAKRMDQLESATKGVSEEMTEWLAANRLQEYAAHMALIAGSYVHLLGIALASA